MGAQRDGRAPAWTAVAAASLSLWAGVLGWLGAHAVTFGLAEATEVSASAHRYAHSAGVAHAHGYTSDLWVVAAAMTVSSLLALVVAARARASDGPVERRQDGRWACLVAAAASAAFVAAELVEAGLTGEHGTPPLLLLGVGAAVQAVVGGLTALLARRGARVLLARVRRRVQRPALVTVPPFVRAGSACAPRPRPWLRQVAGRAPPVACAS